MMTRGNRAMKNSRRIAALAVLALSCASLAAERFAFAYRKGDKFRVLSYTKERIHVDRQFAGDVEILNRVSWEVDQAEGGRGHIKGNFSTSERKPGTGDVFLITTDYDSVYWRDAFGAYEIEDRYFMPIVRNVPYFPDRDLKPGDTWTAPGEERHDLRVEYGINEPFRIPFVASYEYLGQRDYKGKSLPAFSVKYTFFYEAPPMPRAAKAYPVRVMGYSNQLVFWDLKAGQPAGYEETFKFIFEKSNGQTVDYEGYAFSEVIEAVVMDRDAVAKKVEDELKRLGVEDAKVRKDDKGVVISLEKIQFLGDSAVLRASETAKLDKIAEILKGFADRDILVTGHTALASTEERRQAFSEVRARAVADYLVKAGAVTDKRVRIRGMGAREPVADNSTEEGMSRNRRVEITILEN